MKNFKLSVIKNNKEIPLTYFENGEQNLSLDYSTFDENLVEMENSRATLTFSISAFIDTGGQKIKNPFLDLLFCGAILELTIDNIERKGFVISGLQPEVHKNNMIISYTAEDQVSYQWQKRNIGYSFSTSEREEILTLPRIAAIVLKENFLTDWTINTGITSPTLLEKKISLEIENSNPYNVIIEACIILNAYLQINYTQKFIYFIAKEEIKFSGYRYSPNINLSELGATTTTEEMATLLHVKGGQSAQEEHISIVPYIPMGIQIWFLRYLFVDAHKPKKLLNRESINFNFVGNGDERFFDTGVPVEKLDYSLMIDYNRLLDEESIIIDFGYFEDEVFKTVLDENVQLDSTIAGVKCFPGFANKIINPMGNLFVRIKNTTSNSTRFTIKELSVYQLYDQIIPISDTTGQPMVTTTTAKINIGDWYNKNEFPETWYSYILDYIIANDGRRFYYEDDRYITQQYFFGGDDELSQLQEFVAIADKVPHLGQYLADFTYFRNANALTEEQYNHMMSLFNIELRRENILIKMFTPQYYQLDYELNVIEDEMKTHHSSYVGKCQSIKDKKMSETDLITAMQHLDNMRNVLISNDYKYFRNLIALYGAQNDYAAIKNQFKIRFEEEIEANKKLAQEQLNIAEQLEKELATTTDEFIKTQLRAEIEVRISKWETRSTLGDSFIVFTEGNTVFRCTGFYQEMNRLMNQEFNNFTSEMDATIDKNSDGLITIIDTYQKKINNIWARIYNLYGNFILEQEYTNEDEIDSVSLYQQASIHFSNFNKPNANYDIAVLDLSVLELIDIPRLKVGSKIKVYYDKLNLGDEMKNLLQYNDNELLVTEITTNLRVRGAQAIATQKVKYYQVLLEKMLLGLRRK